MATTRIYLCYAHFPHSHTHTHSRWINVCVRRVVGQCSNNSPNCLLPVIVLRFLSVLLSLLLRSFSLSLSLHISFVFQLIAQYLYLILIVFVSAWPVVQFNIYVSRHKTFHFAPCAQLNRWTEEWEEEAHKKARNEGADKIMNCLHDCVERTVKKTFRFQTKLSRLFR